MRVSPSTLVGSLAVMATASMAQSTAHSSHVPPVTKSSPQNEKNYTAPYFPLMNFTQYAGNPILGPDTAYSFESTYVFNPAAIVINDMVWLLYRAQDAAKTSTVGLAWSKDGYHFTRYTQPVVAPTEPYEMPGGCEDPRVVRINGTFYLTYTGYDGTTARLCLATSTDLVHWTKHGPILPNSTDVVQNWQDPKNVPVPRMGWSKSGAIVPARQPDGSFHMHWGDSFLYFANSSDLLNWNFVPFSEPYAPKQTVWELALMESGPPPVQTRDGKWLKIYNGASVGLGGYKPLQYQTGQMLIDPANDPYGPPIARLETPILEPTTATEVTGQVDNVVFSEGLVQFRGQWMLYFGMSDSRVGVATTPVQK